MYKIYLLTLVFSIALTSCKSYPIVGLTNYSKVEQKKEKTDVITWQLVKMNDAVIEKNQGLSIRLYENKAGLHGGCNSGSGNLTLGKNTIRIKNIRITSMACPQEGVLPLESKYYRMISKVKIFSLIGNTLILIGEKITLTYQKKPAVLDATLTNNKWILQTIIENDMAMNMASMNESFFQIGEEKIWGNTGCISFTGIARSDGSTKELVFSKIKFKKKKCTIPLKIHLHKKTLHWLASTTRYSINGKRLKLSGTSDLADFYTK